MTSTAERPIAILSAPGSRGDVNPMVAIGCELKRAGFDVVISLAENYASVAEAAGLQTESLISRKEFERLVGDPNVWKPLNGARTILRDAAGKFLEPHLEVINRHHRCNRTLLVAHPLDFASRIFRDLDSTTPLVSVQLSPAIVRDPHHPPRLTPWWFEPRSPAWFVSVAYLIADYLIADRFLSPSINATRRRLGLPKVSRILDRWWLSPDLVLGMYPDWFGNSRPPCLGHWVACGFPLGSTSSAGVDELIDNELINTALRSTIFVTPGTAHRHASDLFRNASEACELIGKRCVLSTSFIDQLPQDLPSHARLMGYVPLNPLLRSCAAIVHHGGIGTTAVSLATGCPQLICPMAFDQFHNAKRVEALGCGLRAIRYPWRYRRQSVIRLAESLEHVTDSEKLRGRCTEVAGKTIAYQGAVQALNAIQELLRSRMGWV
jgi:rhamnosyltransferase subunit B